MTFVFLLLTYRKDLESVGLRRVGLEISCSEQLPYGSDPVVDGGPRYASTARDIGHRIVEQFEEAALQGRRQPAEPRCRRESGWNLGVA